MKKGILTGLMTVLILSVLVSASQVLAEEVPADQPAWAQETVSVTGAAVTNEDPSIGLGERRLVAQREAKLDALKQITERVYATVTDSGATVGEIIAADETLRGPVDALIQGGRITGTRFLPGGRVEVDMEIELKALPVILGQ